MTKLTPSNATRLINQIASHDSFNRRLTDHAKERIEERGIVMGDVLYLLNHGFVYEEGSPASNKGDWKYTVEGRTPNSGHRSIAAVVIPNPEKVEITIITVMWVDGK